MDSFLSSPQLLGFEFAKRVQPLRNSVPNFHSNAQFYAIWSPHMPHMKVGPILAYINRVEALLGGDNIVLCKQLCRYLKRKVGKMKVVLEDQLATPGGCAYGRDSAVLEFLLVVKRVEYDLVSKCTCHVYLDGAMTLAKLKEELVEIHLDLAWWIRMIKVATRADAGGGVSEAEVSRAVRKHEILLTKLSLDRSKALNTASEEDKLHLSSELGLQNIFRSRQDQNDGIIASTRRSRNFIRYTLARYLLSTSKDDYFEEVPPGDVAFELKKFTEGDVLGQGGYGVVREVTWLNRKCALKVINDHEGVGAKEEIILRRCKHPNIIGLLWHWGANRKIYLMMERMPKDLSTYIREELQSPRHTPFKLHVAIDIMLQIAKAMRYLHTMKIVHRDLKPSNILVQPHSLTSDGYVRVKLADFGISKNYNNTATTSTQTPRQGTPVYAAPEVFSQQAAGLKFPPKADIWSFAMTCSQILTGQIPFENERRENLHARIVADGLRPPLRPQSYNCPDYLEKLITLCWDTYPIKRPRFVEVCKMLKLAKAMSLGVFHSDASKNFL